jgi:hypothetical protein
MDPVNLAAAAVTALAPFLPTLVDIAKEGGKKISAAVGEKVGALTSEKAQELWNKIVGKEKDPAIENVAKTVAQLPENEDLQKALTGLVATKLAQNPDLAQEVMQLLGGQDNVQQIIALRKSWIEDVVQKGAGKKEIRAEDEATIKKAQQES